MDRLQHDNVYADMKIITDSQALVAIADDINHNCLMLNLSDEESAADDLSFYVPRILSAVETLRVLVKKSELAKG